MDQHPLFIQNYINFLSTVFQYCADTAGHTGPKILCFAATLGKTANWKHLCLQ